MGKKFNKYRSVDSRKFNIPLKYMLNFTKGKEQRISIEEQFKSYSEWRSRIDWIDDDPMTYEEYKQYLETHPEENQTVWIPPKHDKDFVIIELSKRWAICGWRNSETCSIGMPIKCKVIHKNNHIGIIYKDRFYPIDQKSGWVF